MNKTKRLLMILTATVMWLFAGGSAHAATECSGVLSGAITGGVIVTQGFCKLQAANVTGGVHVTGGFVMVCGSTINGGFTSTGAAELIIGAEEADCDGNVFNGAVHIANTGPGAIAPAPSIALERSLVHGAVFLTGNQGPTAVSEVRISGSLFCMNNAFDLMNEGNSNQVSGRVTCIFK